MSTQGTHLQLTPEEFFNLTKESFEASIFSYSSYVSVDPATQYAFVAEARKRFRVGQTAPIRAIVKVSNVHAPLLHRKQGDYVVWQVLREGDEIIFYEGEGGAFGKASYIRAEEGRLLDMGFRGDDDPFEIFLA